MISPCKNNQYVCEHHFANVRQNLLSNGAPTETETPASMLKPISIIMENIQKSNRGMMKETDFNRTQTVNCKQNSSVGRTTSQKKQRSVQVKVLKLAWNKLKV